MSSFEQKQQVLTTDHAVPYDYLVLATGTSSNYFGHDAWQRWAPSLKSLQDALTVRHAILGAFEAAENEPDPEKRQALLTFVLVGGGPTSTEFQSHKGIEKIKVAPRLTRITRRRPSQWTLALFYQTAP